MKRQGLLRQKQVSGSRSGRFRKHVQRREQFNQDNHKSSVASKGCTVESKQYVKNNPVRVDLTRGKDERSYKEALLSEKKECQEEMVGKNQTDRKMKQCAEELTGKNRIEQSNIRNQTMGADCRVRRRLL
ncbi:hypothetical protein V6N13_043785 [Hibiscus sabdariffa]